MAVGRAQSSELRLMDNAGEVVKKRRSEEDKFEIIADDPDDSWSTKKLQLHSRV